MKSSFLPKYLIHIFGRNDDFINSFWDLLTFRNFFKRDILLLFEDIINYFLLLQVSISLRPLILPLLIGWKWAENVLKIIPTWEDIVSSVMTKSFAKWQLKFISWLCKYVYSKTILFCSTDSTTNSETKDPELSKIECLSNAIVFDEKDQNK